MTVASGSAAGAGEPRLERELAFARELNEVTNLIHSADSVAEILVNLSERIRGLLGCQAVTLYAVDVRNQQLYSVYKIANARQTIRVPKDAASIAGYCALSRQTLAIRDAYDAAELGRIHPRLEFNRSFDEMFGFRTRQVLAVPLLMEQYLLGVLQLINKVGEPQGSGRGAEPPGDPGGQRTHGTAGGDFTDRDRKAAEEIARTLAIAFYNQNRVARASSGKRHPYSGLVDRGVVAEADLEAAVTSARVQRRDLATVLMAEHEVSKQEIGRALAEFYGVAFFDWDGSQDVPAELKERVPAEFWRTNRCAPLSKRGGTLCVASVDPMDLEKIDAIKATGIAARIELQVALEADLQGYLDRAFGSADAAAGGRGGAAAVVEEGDGEPLTEEGDDEATGDAVVDGFVVRLANRIIADAVRQGASDIHVEPYGDEAPLRVRFRRDGDCFRYQDVPAKHRTALVSRLKIMAQLDISEKRKPQDGKIRFRMANGALTELRVATVPTAGEGNEDVVMRLLAASKPIALDGLGMSPDNLKRFREVIAKPYGLVLCVGPTGSGKTTTLHSALGAINTEDVKIWTAEDPVEITQPGLRQVQVRPKIGFDFAAAMRSFLRADPDVIMVGEMRDLETAGTGIEASLTGHLVFSTLHTNSAPETVTRLLDIGLDPFNFADALLGVLAQRLVRTLCKSCREAYHPDELELRALREAHEVDGPRRDLALSPQMTLYRPKGCEECFGAGYRGRMAIHELLVATDEVKRLIVQKRPVEEVRRQALADGMTTLLQDGVWKVTLGHTDLKQVKAVALR
jgi:type II secretory ATPase GspE/PulE/Tfp pilus assembly ATPase PilB-like protein/GAF domain-containing protein